MKKVLLATTALVAFAGAANAAVELSGSGRMGVVDDGTTTDFTSRARVKFSLSGETDGGLSFGGSFRADNASSANHGAAGSVWIKGSFGELSMGDVDSAAEAAIGYASGVGLTSVKSGNSISYVGAGAANDDPVMLYKYSTDTFAVYLSAQDGWTNPVSPNPPVSRTGSWGVAASYTAGDYTVGLGYEEAGTTKGTFLGGSAKFGAASLKATYGSIDKAGVKTNEYAVSVDYTTGATTLTAYTARNSAGLTGSAYGVGASYDLGGGAAVKGGVSSIVGKTMWDFGVSLSF